MDNEIDQLMKRLKANGILFTKPSVHTRNISKKTDYIVYNNRHLKESVIIDKEAIKRLLNKNLL